MGSPLRKDDANVDEIDILPRPDKLVEDLDFRGLSLEEFVHENEETQQSLEVELEIQNAQSVEECEYVQQPVGVCGSRLTRICR